MVSNSTRFAEIHAHVAGLPLPPVSLGPTAQSRCTVTARLTPMRQPPGEPEAPGPDPALPAGGV